jgi:hypothetical protein
MAAPSQTPLAAEPDPIVIYQMGKVGSRTVWQSLLSIMPRRQALHHLHHMHGLDAIEADLGRRAGASEAQRAYLAAARDLRRRFDAGEPPSWNVITLVRDPVARNLSAFFFGLADEAPALHRRARGGRFERTALLSTFLRDFDHDHAHRWFELQFRPVFELDVFARSFPHERGYDIQQTDRIRLLLLRTEDLDRRLPAAIEDLLGWHGCEPRTANRAADQDYAAAYGSFLEQLVMPDTYLERMYDSRLARHFYTPGEISAFRRHWRKQS